MAALDIVLIKKSSDFYLYFKQIIAQSAKLFVLITKAYSEACRTSMMEYFAT